MTWVELLDAAKQVRATGTARDPGLIGLALVGLGWATVEHERAIRELDAVIPRAPVGPGSAWVAATRDEWLGARAWVRAAAGEEPASIVVLEPDTEGRLAASLARFGEGVAAIYLRRPDDPAREPDGMAVGRDGPLGPGRLVPGGPPWGPHVVVLDEVEG